MFRYINYLALESFDFGRIWWRLSQKHVVNTKIDIFVFIYMKHSKLLHINVTNILKIQKGLAESINRKKTDG